MTQRIKPRASLPDPGIELKQLSQELREVILREIRAEGPMPFSRYMEMAL